MVQRYKQSQHKTNILQKKFKKFLHLINIYKISVKSTLIALKISVKPTPVEQFANFALAAVEHLRGYVPLLLYAGCDGVDNPQIFFSKNLLPIIK